MQDWKIVNSSKYTLSSCTYVFHRCRFVLAFSVLAYSIPRYFRFPYLRFQSPRAIFTNFVATHVTHGHGGMARSSAGCVAIYYVLPVLDDVMCEPHLQLLSCQLSVSMSIKFFNVARIAELCQEKTDKKGMFSDVDGRRAETGKIRCRAAMNSRGAMQRLEMCVDRRLSSSI